MPNHGSDDSTCAPLSMSGMQQRNLNDCRRCLEVVLGLFMNRLEQLTSYDALKKAIVSRLNPDTDQDRLATREQLTRRHFQEGSESINELAGDIEMLLD